MCSIDSEDFGDGTPDTMPHNIKEPNVVEGMCKKCGSVAAVKLSCKEAQCKECFLYYVRHKFRANLGSTKILPRNCSVLTVFDGSPGSVCLLDLVTHSLRLENYKRLNFNHHILILDSNFLRKSVQKESIERILQHLQEQMHYSSLVESECRVEVFNAEDFISKLEAKKDEFARLQVTFSSQTAWEDFVEQRRKNHIRKAAKFLNCSHVFLPDTAVDLATSLLSNVSLGRGASVALDVGFLDDRVDEVTLLRPIRDFTQEEVENYIRVCEFLCLQLPLPDVPGSIQATAQKFIGDLQLNFSSTVSTVFRAGDKLAPKVLNGGRCKFCHSNLDWKESKTLNAVEFSKKVSNSQAVVESSASAKEFCYACQKIICDRPGIFN